MAQIISAVSPSFAKEDSDGAWSLADKNSGVARPIHWRRDKMFDYR